MHVELKRFCFVFQQICKDFKSSARDCLGKNLNIFDQLCKLNMHINVNESVKCSFYEEFLRPCNGSLPLQLKLRNITSCSKSTVFSTTAHHLEGYSFLSCRANNKCEIVCRGTPLSWRFAI